MRGQSRPHENNLPRAGHGGEDGEGGVGEAHGKVADAVSLSSGSWSDHGGTLASVE